MDGDHEEKKIWYYSTRSQLEELMERLDSEYWEADLHAALLEMKEEVQAHMAITEELTNRARGNSKTYLSALNGTGSVFSSVPSGKLQLVNTIHDIISNMTTATRLI